MEEQERDLNYDSLKNILFDDSIKINTTQVFALIKCVELGFEKLTELKEQLVESYKKSDHTNFTIRKMKAWGVYIWWREINWRENRIDDNSDCNFYNNYFVFMYYYGKSNS